MGLHVSGDCPELDRLVSDACAAIGREIDAQSIPWLDGVVLGGGYGRGEGGVKGGALSNDLDFFAITGEGEDRVESIAEALKPISERWTAKLGVDVDFAVKTAWRLKHDEERIMVQELVRGYFDVAGARGCKLFAHIDLRPAEALPWMEAARLLMNRGMGLLFAMDLESAAAAGVAPDGPAGDAGKEVFTARNINKCILGAGDARLVARHGYSWRAAERAKALGDPLYTAAVEWKFRPKSGPVCGWDTARDVWLEAYEYVSGETFRSADSMARNLRNAARWLVRRRSIGEIRTFGLNPVVRVLEAVARLVRTRRAPDGVLLADWRIFN